MSVWLSDAQVDEAGHRQTHIEPVAEAEIVDELEHVLHTQKDQTHQPLQPQIAQVTECVVIPATFCSLISICVYACEESDVYLHLRVRLTLLTLNSSAGMGV